VRSISGTTGPLGYDINRANEERQRGPKYWIYNGGRPAAGAIVIDAPATDPRATIWAVFQTRSRQLLLLAWRALAAQPAEGRGAQAGMFGPIQLRSTTAANQTNQLDDQGYINGDGVLIYPW
jgi:hypothetical protein